MSKKIGLHLRLPEHLVELIHQAVRLNLSFFQCFLLNQKKKTDDLTTLKKAQKPFVKLLEHHALKAYMHASYAINLASGVSNAGTHFLKKELQLAKLFGFSAIVLHPGAATGCKERGEGIDNVARRLNELVRAESEITIILENAAFGDHCIGGDLHDLALIRSKLEKPERIQFCIDTAHAYAFGYDIADEQEQDQFINLIEATIGFDALSLIHLNDTKEQLGSKRDRHDAFGNGSIGAHFLHRFVLYEKLYSVPALLELPLLPEEEQRVILHTVNSWNEK